MRRGRTIRRPLWAAVWTAALAGALFGMDRLLWGPRIEGWAAATAVQEVPQAAGPVYLPAYLPERLRWPPSAIVYRLGDQPAWWLGLSAGQGGAPRLWVGQGGAPLPAVLGDAGRCLAAGPRGTCPPDWRHLSTLIGGQTIQVLGKLDAGELRRVIDSLAPTERATPKR